MSKVVDWGHWVVGALFAAWALDSLGHTVARFPNLLRQHPNDITYVIVDDAMSWIAAFGCAWGILKWRNWARTLGIVLSAIWVLALGIGTSIGLQSGIKPNLYWLLAILISCSVLVWFFVPAVRSEYSRRNQVA